MNRIAELLGECPKLLLFLLASVIVEQPSCAQSQNWAESPPGTFLDQQHQPGNPGQLGQSQWLQPPVNLNQPGQSQWLQPPVNLNQPGQQQWQQPAGNPSQLGQQQWQQPAGNPSQLGQQQWQQPAGNPSQLGQQQWQQPAGDPNQLGQSQWQQPAGDPNQLGQSQWQQPAGNSDQPDQSQWQQPSAQASPGTSTEPATGPFKANGQMSRPPLLGEVMQQEQLNSPGTDSISLDQSSSLTGAANDALNTPVDAMANGALSTFGLGGNPGQQLTPQQIQQMVPGVLNFLQNVMPPPGSTMNAPGFGGFPHFGATGGTAYRRNNSNQGPVSPGMRRAINSALRGGRIPGMNQFHF